MKKILAILCSSFLIQTYAVAQNALLWRIDSRDGEKPSYLFGTVHLAQQKFVMYTDSLYAAIQNTDHFYGELNFMSLGSYGDGSMLKEMMEMGRRMDSLRKTEGWKSFIGRVNKSYNVGLKADSMDQFIQFTENYLSKGYENEIGMTAPDLLLSMHAKYLGKEVGGLETYAFQFRMLFELVEARVNDTTLQLEDEVKMVKTLKDNYLTEQLDDIGSMIENMNPTYKEMVFDRRNRTMADSIEKHTGNQPSFFAIGAGHLPGTDGVISLLRKKGFIVSPVKSDNRISILVMNNMLKMASKTKNTENGIEDIEALQEGVKVIEEVQEPPPAPPTHPSKISIEKKPEQVKKKTKG